MLCRTYSAALVGVEGRLVTVEADVGLGLPGMTIVGQASGALTEARERVRSALAHCGHDIRPRKQIVNLAPAQLRKDSPGIDLPVAVALLAAHEVVPRVPLERLMFWGELALDGQVRPVGGTLVVADCARAHGFSGIVVARANASEAALISGLDVFAIDDLAQLVRQLRGIELMQGHSPASDDRALPVDCDDMADVRGLNLARLGVEVMAAGGHNLLLHGPPGVGKTMLARRAGGLLPPLDENDALEVTKIHSVASGLVAQRLLHRPPWRAPHHTVTSAGLLGGGTPPRPGEISLAHRGLLFLDEVPEFRRSCLEGLREPLEEGAVTIVRANHVLRFPARFQLLAAMNPCPCGYLGHPQRACSDSAVAVQRYQQRLSGPFLDRIDIAVPILAASLDELARMRGGEASDVIRDRIVRARGRQRQRLAEFGWATNAQIPARANLIERLCPLSREAELLLRSVAASRGLSPRALHRLRRVALTVADLRDSDRPVEAVIHKQHVAEALHLRRLPASVAIEAELHGV